MKSLPNATLGPLEEADALLRRQTGAVTSLSPDRDEATPLRDLGRELFSSLRPRTAASLADGLSDIVTAQIAHFPETIFWDFDYLTATLARGAHDSTPEAVARLTDNIVLLQEQYGCQSVICFRYVHDFTYGFDWAKCVRRNPTDRMRVGPFDRRFVDYLMKRGGELEELIAQNDEKYPKLPDGTPRNPFGFSREPDDERRLFVELAARNLLPVRTWEIDATPVWDRPFADLRASVAAELGTPTK
jgi:hypothetical protein